MKNSVVSNYARRRILIGLHSYALNYFMTAKVLAAMLVLMLFMSGCGTEQFFYCIVSGYGSIPEAKSYYITPRDSAPYEELEYEEYSQTLSRRLEESGYLRTTPDRADICIYFDYNVGPKEAIGQRTTTKNSSISFTNENQDETTSSSGKLSSQSKQNGRTLNSKVSTNTKSSGHTYGNHSTFSLGSATTNSTVLFSREVHCVIRAVDTKNQKDLWLVEVNDVLYGSNSFRKVMPWLLTSAQNYFGKSGESTVKIMRKDGEQNRGLVWPY